MRTATILQKQLAIEHQGGSVEYESFKRMIDASPLLYKHDLDVYTDEISERHIRNIAEINYLQQLIRTNKIEPSMLANNVFNAYYPSYVLHHHYQVFMPLVGKVGGLGGGTEIQRFGQAVGRNQVTGAFLHETRSVELEGAEGKKVVPILDENGVLQMPAGIVFYSAVSSPYLTHAAFISEAKTGKCLTIVRIRDEKGEFSEKVQVKDLGDLISKDYLPVGYNFAGIKPLFIIHIDPKPLKSIEKTHLQQEISELNFSLKDFQKSLWITVKYTSMRKQFRTIEGSKTQRNLISYQAVAARIINAFAEFEALSDFYSKILHQRNSQLLLGEMLKSVHHSILEHLIQLRQCCGGFGYLQISGHPGCIERTCARSGRDSSQYPPLPRAFLKASQFYTGSEEMQKYCTQQVTDKEVSFMQYFSIFLSICRNMRNQPQQQQLTGRQFKQQFLKQTCIIAMHGREEFLRHEGDNVHCQLLQYQMLGYIAKNAAFVSWDLVKIGRKAFFEALTSCRAECFGNIVVKLYSLASTLELYYLRNTVVGRVDSQQFYTELVEAARSNKRNSKEYAEYIRGPIVEMLTESRSKL